MNLIFILIAISFSTTFGLRNYPKCKKYDKNATILNTLKGQVKGSCQNITVKYEYKKDETNQVLKWLGVPFAQPPINNLRFKNPVPVRKWKELIDGTKWASRCIQIEGDGIDENSSEDCLYLNIFVPYNIYVKSVIENNLNFKAPIYIWIHGGNNVGGSASDESYDASTIVAMSEIIVVTINYRLGPFGFFTISNTDAIGNQGFLDQRMAIKWVYKNSALFGGDNTKITIGGESAGAWNVGFHLLSKKSWPYFRNAILESGSAADASSYNLRTPEEATKLSLNAGKSLGCKTTNHSKLLECLQSVDANNFYNASIDEFNNYVELLMPHIFDGDVFTDQPRVLIESGKHKKCNLLIGTNTHEFLLWSGLEKMNIAKLLKSLPNNPGSLPYDFEKYYLKYNITGKNDFFNKIIELYIKQERLKNKTEDFVMDYISMITDECYKCPAYKLSEYYSKYNLSTYVYLYGHRISNSDMPFIDGASHGEEISIVFADPLSSANKKYSKIISKREMSENFNYSINERKFTEKIVNYWTNFIKNGDPNNENTKIKWPAFNDSPANQRNVMFLKADLIYNTIYNTSNEKCDFWNL